MPRFVIEKVRSRGKAHPPKRLGTQEADNAANAVQSFRLAFPWYRAEDLTAREEELKRA